MTNSTKLNGSVDRLAEALRDVVREAVAEEVERTVKPTLQQHGETLAQHGILLRALAHQLLPKETLAELGE